MADCSTALESAGEGIMKRIPATQIGSYFLVASEKMEQLAVLLLPESILSADATNESSGNTAASITAASDASNRMMIASQQMKISGNLLIGIQPEVPKGRSFLKGGGM